MARVELETLSIGELADAAGITRRAVRFYVQQRLLPPPTGRGRGRHYDRSHLERLRRVMELQESGYALDAIRRLLDGEAVEAPDTPARPQMRASISAALWTRVTLMEGVELHFDSRRHRPDVEELLKLRDAARAAFVAKGDDDGSDGTAD